MMDLTREYYEAVRDCTPEDCGDCILRPATNRACYTVDVDPGKEARMILGLMDERDALRARVAELEAENARIIQDCTRMAGDCAGLLHHSWQGPGAAMRPTTNASDRQGNRRCAHRR